MKNVFRILLAALLVLALLCISLVPAVAETATGSAKGFGGKKDYSNPEFKMMINATIGGPLRSMQISGGIKGGIMPGLLEMANGHFFRGIWKMIKG